MIIAEGTKNGKRLMVEYVDGTYLFNGKVDFLYETEIEYELSRRHTIGGTYYPERNETLNILNVIENWFFDRNVEAEVIDEEITEIPDDGEVY